MKIIYKNKCNIHIILLRLRPQRVGHYVLMAVVCLTNAIHDPSQERKGITSHTTCNGGYLKFNSSIREVESLFDLWQLCDIHIYPQNRAAVNKQKIQKFIDNTIFKLQSNRVNSIIIVYGVTCLKYFWATSTNLKMISMVRGCSRSSLST